MEERERTRDGGRLGTKVHGGTEGGQEAGDGRTEAEHYELGVFFKKRKSIHSFVPLWVLYFGFRLADGILTVALSLHGLLIGNC